MPLAHVLSSSTLDIANLWGKYLHSRAAWECGGDIHLAHTYGSTWSTIPRFDDDALEKSCALLAKRCWSEVSPAARAEFERYLADADLPFQQNADEQRTNSLVEEGLLWKSPNQFHLIPTAWAVRATATCRAGNGRLQRAALVNSVLVSEALACCFQLEMLERARYDEGSEVSDCAEANENFANFSVGRKNSAASLYPKDYPFQLLPRDFEPFGWYCNRLGMEKRTVLRKRLLSLRNGLCHGHFAGWRTIYDLVTIHAQMF